MRVNSTEAQCWRADIPDLMQIGSGMQTPNSHEIILKDGRKETCPTNITREDRARQGDAVRPRQRQMKGWERERKRRKWWRRGGSGSCWFALGVKEAWSMLHKLQPCQITSVSLPASFPACALMDQHTLATKTIYTDPCAHTNLKMPSWDTFLESYPTAPVVLFHSNSLVKPHTKNPWPC